MSRYDLLTGRKPPEPLKKKEPISFGIPKARQDTSRRHFLSHLKIIGSSTFSINPDNANFDFSMVSLAAGPAAQVSLNFVCPLSEVPLFVEPNLSLYNSLSNYTILLAEVSVNSNAENDTATVHLNFTIKPEECAKFLAVPKVSIKLESIEDKSKYDAIDNIL